MPIRAAVRARPSRACIEGARPAPSRPLASSLLLGALCLASAAAAAQPAYPSRPVRFVAPFAPGGLVDVLARLTGERLAAPMCHPFVV